MREYIIATHLSARHKTAPRRQYSFVHISNSTILVDFFKRLLPMDCLGLVRSFWQDSFIDNLRKSWPKVDVFLTSSKAKPRKNIRQDATSGALQRRSLRGRIDWEENFLFATLARLFPNNRLRPASQLFIVVGVLPAHKPSTSTLISRISLFCLGLKFVQDASVWNTTGPVWASSALFPHSTFSLQLQQLGADRPLADCGRRR